MPLRGLVLEKVLPKDIHYWPKVWNKFYISSYFHCELFCRHIVLINIEHRSPKSVCVNWNIANTPGRVWHPWKLSDFLCLAYKRPSYLTWVRLVWEQSYYAYALSDITPSHIGRELVQHAIRLCSLRQSQKTIAYMLGITPGAVSKILHRHRETGDTGPRPRSGRPRVTTDRENRSLVRMQLRSHFQSAPLLRSE